MTLSSISLTTTPTSIEARAHSRMPLKLQDLPSRREPELNLFRKFSLVAPTQSVNRLPSIETRREKIGTKFAFYVSDTRGAPFRG
jgi:hypothetical protein